MIRLDNLAVRIAPGTLEALKWFALVCMLVDHVNVVFYARELPLWATVAGRIAFPLFALVFAYNLARPGAEPLRSLNRLVIAAAIAQPFHGLLFGTALGLWPLNILFLFAAVVVAVALLERGRDGFALMAMGAAGLLVEYGFCGVLLCVTAWAFFRRPSWSMVLGVAVSMAGLCWLNGNAYALLALPLFIMAGHADVGLPRARWAFYAFYPAHLAALLLLR